MQSQESYFNCRLPDGRNVDLMTCEGANAFVGANGEHVQFEGFSSNIEAAEKIQQKIETETVLTSEDKEQLQMIYVMIDEVSNNASEYVFKNIKKSEFERWYDHVNGVLTKLTKDNTMWRETGKLEEYDMCIISACISMSKHLKAVEVAFEKDFFNILAKFIAGREAPLLPCADVAEIINFIIGNTRVTYQKYLFKMNYNSSIVWEKLESNGILLQFIRCSTIPQTHENHGLYFSYENLIECLPQIKEKFQPGQPCGDIVTEILSGANGNEKNNEKILNYIRNMAKIMEGTIDAVDAVVDTVDTVDSVDTVEAVDTKIDTPQPKTTEVKKKNSDVYVPLRVCRVCSRTHMLGEPQTPLMACGQCRKTFYCSRQCQKKDWKTHKLDCVMVMD
jgi:hypothetical protein